MGSRREQRKREEALAEVLARTLKEGERRGLERTLLAAAQYVLGREVAQAAAELASSGPTTALRALGIAARTVWPTRWRDALAPVLSAVMQNATEPAAPVFGSFTLANPAMREYLDGYTSELADTLSRTSYGNFERILREGQGEGLSVPEVSKRLEERLPEANRERADLIARTELIRSSNGAALKQAQGSGVVRGKRWLSAGDGRVREAHQDLDGTVVGIDEPFPNGLMFPGEPRCRCTLTWELDMDAIRGGAA